MIYHFLHHNVTKTNNYQQKFNLYFSFKYTFWLHKYFRSLLVEYKYITLDGNVVSTEIQPIPKHCKTPLKPSYVGEKLKN